MGVSRSYSADKCNTRTTDAMLGAVRIGVHHAERKQYVCMSIQQGIGVFNICTVY